MLLLLTVEHWRWLFRKRFADFNLFLFLFSYVVFIMANDNTLILKSFKKTYGNEYNGNNHDQWSFIQINDVKSWKITNKRKVVKYCYLMHNHVLE